MIKTEIRLIIVCSWTWRSSIQSAKTRPGADCGLDHELLIAKFILKLKKVRKITSPFRYDLNQIPCDYRMEVMNRVKGLDLVDRGPEELWTEVCTGVSDKNHPREKEMQEGRVVVWGAFTNSRGKKGTEKPGRNGYSQLNAELQRTAGREKAFRDQCKEVEENNRVGRTSDLFKKIGDIRGTFHARMGTIKDRKCMGLTEGEEIKRGGEKTQRRFGLGGGKSATLSSQIRVLPTPAASTMPPKFDPCEIKVTYLRCTSEEFGATSAPVPKTGPLGLSPKKLCDNIARATGDWEGLRIPVDWSSRTDRPGLRWCLLLLPWSSKPSGNH